jgi:hypothetical protein
MTVVSLCTPRSDGGQFAPGHSGNPAGRPKGARNRATLAAEALVADNAEELTARLVAAGLAGDGATLRFLLGRFLPAAKDRSITLDVAAGQEADFVHLHTLLVRAMADGEITPQEALAAARVIAIGAKLTARQRKFAVDPLPTGEREGPGARERDGKVRGRSERGDASGSARTPSPSPLPLAQAGRGDRPLTLTSLRRGEGAPEPTPAPVPPLYFWRPCGPDLRGSTSLSSGGLRLFPPVYSRAPSGSTGRAAA